MFNQLIKTVDRGKQLEQCQIFDDIYFTSGGTETLAILLSPICDIKQGKIDHFIFCALLPYQYLFFDTLKKEGELKDINIFDAELSKSKTKKILVPIQNIVGNRLPRFHWLGILPQQTGFWYVDYQLIQTFPISSLNTLTDKRVLEVLSPLNQSVSVSFSNYLGRIGLPVEKEEIATEVSGVFEYLKRTNGDSSVIQL